MSAGLRPPALYPWFTPLSRLKGVGPATLTALQRLLPRIRGISDAVLTIRHLLLLAPTEVIDRRHILTVVNARTEQYAMLALTIGEHFPPPRNRPRAPYRITAEDATGSLMLTFFNVKGDYLKRQLPTGQVRLIGGEVSLYDGIKNIAHPDVIAPLHQQDRYLRVLPIYPLTAGMGQRSVQRLMEEALKLLVPLPEWINPQLLTQKQWPGCVEAFRQLHAPQTPEECSGDAPARIRLAYDEALANQLTLQLMRRSEQEIVAQAIPFSADMQTRFEQAIPYTLTQGQRDVMTAMANDMASGIRMVRLLQGDVGSGKTLVAFAAMAQVVAFGKQAALMAPTDLLARQHAQSLKPLAEALGVSLVFLSGKLNTGERKHVTAQIASGEAQVVIGTHALFQDAVAFADLALVVVDEQHRFGVEQRMRLTSKGDAPHLLQMSATPIPRSLTMTAYGDMDVSLLTEKPAGRQPIDTRAIPLSRADEVVDAVARALAQGQKLYWLCPLIEQSEETSDQADMAAAEERFRVLKARFGEAVGLVHGRMKPDMRAEVMEQFAFGPMQLLVATTVIEVGVNVPEATIMVIEHAERFGLAQLHQLRGRVGRSDAPSRCILLYDPECSELAKEKLGIIRATNDGFAIAEEDLRLRGAGDVLGTRQTGLPEFHFLNLALHGELVRMARDDAKHILHEDPSLSSPRGEACRMLLALLGYDEEVAALRAA
jgi:ATP-dependent DNA helicase RecG